MDSEPTIDLLRRARDGDSDAWISIDKRYRDALIRIAHGQVGGALKNRLDTEDLLQSTYLAAFRELDGFVHHGPGSFQAWLKKVLMNRVRQRLRCHMAEKRDVRRHANPVALEAWLDMSSLDPGEAALKAEQETLLIEAIDELPEEDRDLIVATLIHRIPSAVYAAELGIHEATVRRRRAKVILALENKLL